MVESLGRSQASRTGANDEDVNIAVVERTDVSWRRCVCAFEEGVLVTKGGAQGIGVAAVVVVEKKMRIGDLHLLAIGLAVCTLMRHGEKGAAWLVVGPRYEMNSVGEQVEEVEEGEMACSRLSLTLRLQRAGTWGKRGDADGFVRRSEVGWVWEGECRSGMHRNVFEYEGGEIDIRGRDSAAKAVTTSLF